MYTENKFFKNKVILITGGCGFIGSVLANRLKMGGAKVIILDKKNGIDICNWDCLSSIKVGKNIDCVYHLAGLSFVPYAWDNPRDMYSVNLLSTMNILEFCRIKKIKKLVFMSSYIYGKPKYLPVDEKHPVAPFNPYAWSKKIGEDLCMAYSKDYGIKSVILRPFNIYGIGQDKRFLISQITEQVLNNQKIKLNDPNPKRDYLYIDDFVELLIKVLEYEPLSYEIFNVGYGKSYSVREIMKYVQNIYGKNIRISYLNKRRKNEVMNVVADISKASKILKWKPEINIAEGLAKLLKI